MPHDNPDLLYLASNYQQSDKPSSSLRLQETESHFTKVRDKTTLHLKHPAEAFACNLRAYISTALPALECSMDFQTTENRAMLLRYVTSYVTKWQDGISSDSLYSYNISGSQAAVRYVMEMKPAEPKMWLFHLQKINGPLAEQKDMLYLLPIWLLMIKQLRSIEIDQHT